MPASATPPTGKEALTSDALTSDAPRDNALTNDAGRATR